MGNAKRTRRRIVALVLLALLCVAVVFGLRAIERMAVFPGTARPAPSAPHRDADVFRVGDAQVEAWLLPPLEGASPRGLVVFAHGNGELIDDWGTRVRPYRRRGLTVLMVEYRGYGRSKGTPDAPELVRDLDAALTFVTEERGHSAERIVLHGRSLGGGVVRGVMKRWSPAGLILESTFTSLEDRASEMGFPRFLLAQDFGEAGVVSRYEGPTLIVHGTRDKVIPFAHAEKNLASARDGTLHRTSSGHNDLSWDTAYWAAVDGLLDQALPTD